ncbi:MAG: hypothetical protein OEY00_08815 [Gammaproteobacteria bacterium]|nr:hypothetical protein [Gammaproteobacteria bacterium]
MTTTLNHLHMGCGESLRSSIWQDVLNVKSDHKKTGKNKSPNQKTIAKDKKSK